VRETRGAWRHFAGLLACVGLGVAALVAVGTFGANLDRALQREGKALLGGDLELRSPRPLGEDVSAALAALVAGGATTTSVRELVGMARAPERARAVLVEVKAVGAGYPLYGGLETRPPQPLPELLAGDGLVVEEALLARLGLAVGDRVALGNAVFTVRGTVVREPDRAGSLLTLGPRVLLREDALARTGLVQFGSRVRHRALVRLPDDEAAGRIRDELARQLNDPAVRVVAFDEAQPGLRRFFDQLTTYLGLVALATLFVGGIGVAAAVRTFVRTKRQTIAILKCLGAGSRVLLAAYLVQSVALGLVGSLAGAALGVALQPVLIGLLGDVLPFAVDVRPGGWSVTRAVLMGGLTTLLVALWPLLEVRTVPPSVLLRREVDAAAPARAGRRWPVALPIAAGLAGLVLWQAGSVRTATIFVGATVAALFLLAALARGVIAVARRVPRVGSLAWRQGIANLARPGGHAAGVIVALGVGVMLLVAVALLEASLDRQLDHERRREVPSFFFVDVQADQRDRLVAIVRDAGQAEAALIPVVRARLAGVEGSPVTRDFIAGRRRDGSKAFYFTRDYVLTATDRLPEGNEVIRGAWWTGTEPGGRPLLSVEEDAARNLGVDLGDTLTFDIQGVPVEGTVASVRRVDWQTLSTNFLVIFSPGVLDGAPTMYLATARVAPVREAAVQNRVAAELPNVTTVPVRDIVERVDTVLGRIAFAVRAIALLAIAVGLAVMAGALAASRYQRLVESVILRTLGAPRAVVARIFAVEYACLGAAAGIGGSVLASLLAWVVLRFVLETPWIPAPGVLALGVAVATSVAVAVGFLATFRLLGQKPLPVLRQE
jgi:putative ABC transport system permease protein